MQSVQLKNIQIIENQLLLLKSKIQKMSKLDSQNQETLHKLVSNTIPVVEKKLKESQILQSMQSKKSIYNDRWSEMRKKNKESRLINEKEVNRSKQLVSLMKHHNSLHLKQSKKENEERIKKIKELHLNQKKNKTSLVKKRQQDAQAKIQEFHQHKRIDLRLKREQQCKENEQKINQLIEKMKRVAKEQVQMEQRVKASQESINKFRKVIHKVDKMKSQQFLKFKEEISPVNKLKDPKSLSEAMLQYAAKYNR